MRIVPARHGVLWLQQGWKLFRKSPAAWIFLSLGLLLATGFINLIPWVGPALATALIPVFSVSFMAACATAAGDGTLRPGLLLEGFRQGGTPLYVLCGLYLMAMLMALGLSTLADNGVMLRWMLLSERPPDAAILDGSLAGALALAALATTPVLMAFWFAPVLVAWQNIGAAQALFYSFFASLRNWRAFAVYAGSLGAIGFSVSLFLTALVPLLKGGAGEGLIVMLPTVLVMLNVMFLPVLFASFYFSYLDIFPDEGPDDLDDPLPGSADQTPG